MKISSNKLIDELIEKTRQNLNEAEKLNDLSLEKLNRRPGAKSWSALECIEHLNRYSDFYIPEISKRIKASTKSPQDEFQSRFLGNYFAKSMLPKDKLNKMNTFKNMNPLGSQLDKSTLEKFIAYQKKTLDLLDQARNVNLSKTKTSITISNLIKLMLGDTFRVVIYHNYRHIRQAWRSVED